MKNLKYFLPLFMMLMSTFVPCHAEEAMSKENKIKSAIILNFIRYTEWPKNSFSSDADDINICIYTNSELEKTFSKSDGKKINDRKINIRPLYRLRNLDECHVLYADNLDRDQASRTFSSIHDKPVLTISDQAPKASSAGIINLIQDKGKLRFEISRKQSDSANLKLSSRLIKLSVNN